MERPHLASASERYSLEGQPLRLSSEHDEPPSSASLREGMHLASLAEKKRLWWRNAIINTLFIASWYGLAIAMFFVNAPTISPQVLLLDNAIVIQQMDVLADIPGFSCSRLRHYDAHVYTVYSCGDITIVLAQQIQAAI